MTDFNSRIDTMLRGLPALPVVTVDSVDSAVELGRTLVRAGLHVIEVTLRTPESLAAIREMSRSVEGLVVGAGTVCTPADLERAFDAGARFAVSPGASATLYRAAADHEQPLLPGVATASEILAGLDAGWTRFKFFPAEVAGGVAALRAFAGPFARVAFCPTGGIDATNAGAYRSLSNVMTVGGSWMVPREALAAGDWPRIEALARDCVEAQTAG